jgi:hypothetical protein
MVMGSRLKTFGFHLLFAALIVLQGCEKPQTSSPVTSADKSCYSVGFAHRSTIRG